MESKQATIRSHRLFCSPRAGARHLDSSPEPIRFPCWKYNLGKEDRPDIWSEPSIPEIAAQIICKERLVNEAVSQMKLTKREIQRVDDIIAAKNCKIGELRCKIERLEQKKHDFKNIADSCWFSHVEHQKSKNEWWMYFPDELKKIHEETPFYLEYCALHSQVLQDIIDLQDQSRELFFATHHRNDEEREDFWNTRDKKVCLLVHQMLGKENEDSMFLELNNADDWDVGQVRSILVGYDFSRCGKH